MSNEVKKIASISVKTLGYSAKDIRKLVEDTNETLFLARIGGVVGEAFTGESKNGHWTGFKGLFTAVNRDKVAMSSTVFFPPENLVKKIVDQLNQGIVEVEFLADVYVTATEKNASGYSYICEPVMSDNASKKADCIAQRVLSSKLPTAKLLAAPAKKSA